MKVQIFKPDYNFKYFLLLMQSVLNSTEPPTPKETVNWQTVYDIAVGHSLGAMLYYAIDKLPKDLRPEESILMYLRQMYREQLVADLNLTVETERMLKVLSDNGIPALPVKGINTKSDYPLPHLRSMTDVDVLVDFEKRLSVEKIFLQNGYEKEGVGEKDTSYRKDEILHFEMHTSLLSKESPAFGYFSEIWDRVEYKENSKTAYMTLEDTYIFMLEHLASHIEFGGAGIRMYMDVYVFNQKHCHELNRAYVDKILKKILLSDFEKQTLLICKNWFSGDEEIDVYSPVCQFILHSCTFGRADISFLSATLREDKDGKSSAAKNGIVRILKKLFPKVSWMRLRYKAVDKLPVLYPVFVPVHWVEWLIIKRNVTTANIGDYFVSANSQKAVKLKEIFTAMGLEKRI